MLRPMLGWKVQFLSSPDEKSAELPRRSTSPTLGFSIADFKTQFDGDLRFDSGAPNLESFRALQIHIRPRRRRSRHDHLLGRDLAENRAGEFDGDYPSVLSKPANYHDSWA